MSTESPKMTRLLTTKLSSQLRDVWFQQTDHFLAIHLLTITRNITSHTPEVGGGRAPVHNTNTVRVHQLAGGEALLDLVLCGEVLLDGLWNGLQQRQRLADLALLEGLRRRRHDRAPRERRLRRRGLALLRDRVS